MLILLIVFINLIAACGDSGKANGTEETSARESTGVTVETENKRPPLAVPAKDFGGKELRILSIWTHVTGNNATTVSDKYFSDLVYVPERIGEPINDAIFARNLKILEDFNVVIVVTEVQNVYNEARKIITSGEDAYDLITPYIDDSFKLAQEKFLYNLYKIPGLELDNPWWDQVLIEKLSLNNKLFTITGDISFDKEELNWSLFANKVLMEEHKLNNLYDVVKDGKWTFDYVHQIGASVTRDLNGDGITDWQDLYAFGNNSTGSQFFYLASGENIAKLDSDGYPQLTVGSERSLNVMEKITVLFNDNNFMLWADKIAPYVEGGSGWGYFRVMFKENRLMILMTNIYAIKELRDMFDDFAIIPPPKYDERQDNYYTIVSTHACFGYCIPVTVPSAELERVGVLLEAMSYHSKPVLEAHLDVTITGKFLRDEESREMLEIVFNNRTYDIGKAFGWGDYISQIHIAVRDNKAFAPLYEANRAKAEVEIQKSYNIFLEIDG